MCIDSVVVTLTSAMGDDQYNGSTSGSGDSETRTPEESLVLVPVVTEEGITLVLGQHLLIPHTHYTATLSLQSGHFITTHFCKWETQYSHTIVVTYNKLKREFSAQPSQIRVHRRYFS